jgi:phosphopantetheinyl transferase (holo-ACP synthase)
MIGNDIVDLRQSRLESNWQRKGWIDKLFSIEEQAFLSVSSDREKIIWLLWSMKEAAYKIVNRCDKKSFFAPAKFHCSLKDLSEHAANGIVSFQDIGYPVKSIICEDFIHTIAYAPLAKNIYPHLIIQPIAHEVQLQPHFAFYKDMAGIPFIFNNKDNVTIAASLSHHGRYRALVF